MTQFFRVQERRDYIELTLVADININKLNLPIRLAHTVWEIELDLHFQIEYVTGDVTGKRCKNRK